MKLKIVLIFIVLLASIYQDCPLVNVFGELARTPIVFMSIPMGLYLMLSGKFYISKYNSYLILYLLYLVIISVFYLAFVIIYTGDVNFLGENLIVKAIKMAVYPGVIIVYYQFIYTWLDRGEDKFTILLYALIGVEIFITLFLIVESVSLDSGYFLTAIHASKDGYWRIRLLTYEESWIGSIITILIFLPVFLVGYLNKPKRLKNFVYCLSAFLFVYYTLKSQSKGYLLLVLVSIMPLVIKKLYDNKETRKLLYAAIPVILIISVGVYFSLSQIVAKHWYTSGSFGTRFGSYAASLSTFVCNPLGVGLGSFIYYFAEAINDILRSEMFSGLVLSEIMGYRRTTQALSTKTYFFDHLIMGGIGFLVFFYYFFIKRYFFFSNIKRTDVLFIIIPLVFVTLGGVVYFTYDIKYEVWFLMAFTDVLQKKLMTTQNDEA
ncbi:hypothetical protein [Flavobacterium sp. AG291]|uniref:hypothetical protein n=1 Tax=Flavobacterium sp. AG291 TaxID=2184000 RepID=UPI000E0BBF7F|nr:hypothetical protein [Flavobacterium sp. AG291]RDI07970.1 hypothetical protein DEU42_11260 [Flavobacterium sp. AG291]